LGVLHGVFQQAPVVMAIGKQADFHGNSFLRNAGLYLTKVTKKLGAPRQDARP
jgi:hypothetical protein